MRMMRRSDAQTQEDGFHWLAAHAAEHLGGIVAEFEREFEREVERGGPLRGWLLELVGEARSPEAFDLLVRHLYGEDPELRHWAARGLRKLDTKEARKEARRVLWEVRSHAFASEEQTREFREWLEQE